MASISTVTTVIAAGEAVSGGINTTTYQVAAILIPADWEPIANVTFQVSADGVTYNDVHDTRGNEIMMAAKPGTAIAIDLTNAAWLTGVGWIKIRAGSRDNPVAQTAQRTLTVFLK